MSLVTLEIGPIWKMQLLRGLLEERGVPAFVADTNLKLIDPVITGAFSFDAHLQVPEDALEYARAALAEARAEARALEPGREDAPSGAPAVRAAPGMGVEDLADLGRRIRWATILVWMHPVAFLYGVRYLRSLARVPDRPAGHVFTMLALVALCLFWSALLFLVLHSGP